MLETRDKSPWRKLLITGTPTVGQVYAAAGGNPTTLGYAMGSGPGIGAARISGASAVCLPWGAAAVAVARITRVGDRIKAIVAKGARNGLPPATPARTITAPELTSAFVNGFRRLYNPWGTTRDAVGTFSTYSAANGTHDHTLTVTVQPGGRPQIIGSALYNPTFSRRLVIPAGGWIEWTFTNFSVVPNGAWDGMLYFRLDAGGVYTIPGQNPAVVAAQNAEAAIPLLDATSVLVYGNTVPWWPMGEALAHAGTWMRRRSWADTAKRIRFEPGAGTTPAVLVVIDTDRPAATPVLASDFGASEFLAADWESYGLAAAGTLLDVTDFRFDSLLGGGAGFFFAVDAPTIGEDPLEPLEPTPGGGVGGGVVEVRLRLDGVEQWAPGVPFACPVS